MPSHRLTLILLFAVGALVATTLAATIGSSAPGGATSGISSVSDDVAARIGGRTLMLSDLDARWQHDDPAGYMDAVQKMYDGRKKALEATLGEQLVDEEASRHGLTREQFLTLQMAERIEPVQERDVLAFYAANAEQLGGSLEQHRARLTDALEERARRRAYNALVSDLAAKAGDAVGIVMEPPRYSPPVSDGDPSLGNADAPVTIVVFSDFQCPFCARVEPTLKQLHEMYGDRLRIVWKDFPLASIHPEAFKAAEASHCAGEQQRYRAFHDRLFAHQARMQVSDLVAHAKALRLDVQAFEQCLMSSRHAGRVQEGLQTGRKLGVEATPTLFVNGRTISGAQPVDVFASLIEEELGRAGIGR